MRHSFVLAFGIVAQQPKLPPIRPIGAIVARSVEPLSDVQAIRVLSDGQVLVNDAGARRLVLLDSTLTHVRPIADAHGAPTRQYGASTGALLPFRGDSSVYFDLASATVQVLDPAGALVRSVPLPPRASAVGDMTAKASRAAVDHVGRIVYRAPPPFYLSLLPPTFVGDTIVSGPDSLPLLRFDPVTKRQDTAAMIQAPRVRQALSKYPRGGQGRPARDPIAVGGDDWVVLTDGTIAIIRIRDYHVDWVRTDLSMTSGPKVAHQWERITDEMKRAIMDSFRIASGGAKTDSTFAADSAKYDSLALVAVANPDAILGPDGKSTRLGPRPVRMQFVAPADLPDNWPPFMSGTAVADGDGNVWVAAARASEPNRGLVYDVINPRGVLLDRVEIALGQSLVGFCPGFAILQSQVGPRVEIAKARIR